MVYLCLHRGLAAELNARARCECSQVFVLILSIRVRIKRLGKGNSILGLKGNRREEEQV